jgi:uracil-DNA glycosylase
MARKTTPAAKATTTKDSFPTAAAFMPPKLDLPHLQQAAAVCRGCPLYKTGTQTVFGDGPPKASVVFVGEQPGDQEDQAGRPFVGPAGKMLDAALDQVGIDRGEVYVTNTVKHFKWEPRGTKRIHAKPNAREIDACRPWLESEIAAVKPKLIVCLGATASQALLGKQFRVTQDHGKLLKDTQWAPGVVATIHPSALLRMPDEDARERARAQFVDDLKVVKREMARISRDQADANAADKARHVHAEREAHAGDAGGLFAAG